MCVRMCDVCICVCMCCVCVVVVVLALKCNAQVLVCWGMWWCLRVGACGGACVLEHVVVVEGCIGFGICGTNLQLADCQSACTRVHVPGCMYRHSCSMPLWCRMMIVVRTHHSSSALHSWHPPASLGGPYCYCSTTWMDSTLLTRQQGCMRQRGCWRR